MGILGVNLEIAEKRLEDFQKKVPERLHGPLRQAPSSSWRLDVSGMCEEYGNICKSVFRTCFSAVFFGKNSWQRKAPLHTVIVSRLETTFLVIFATQRQSVCSKNKTFFHELKGSFLGCLVRVRQLSHTQNSAYRVEYTHFSAPCGSHVLNR
jgi:hypothetical protein